jgi:purine nucleoside permease
VPELLGAPEYNKEGWPRVVKANASRETPTKVALRHRAKSDATTKRRRPAVAALHGDTANTNNWWHGQPQRGHTCSFRGWCGQ